MIASRGKLLKVPAKEYLLEPVKLIIIPVTTHRVYLYHKHREDMLSKSSVVIRFESWLSRKSESMWNKIVQSPRPTNQKVVKMINRLLDKTPWMENSLKTLPGENRLVKRVISRDEQGKEKVENIAIKQYVKNKDRLETKPLHAYYPSGIISPEQLSSSLKFLYNRGLLYHWRQTLWCLSGLPLTLPIVLVPIIPNIPGFYLAYRAYCNYKAYMGARHLQMLHKDGKLQLRDVEGYSEMFGTEKKLNSDKEQLLMDTDLMARILDLLEIHEIEPDLKKVIRQEKKRLGL
ncbi:ZYRO0C09482p [Zygosaccharomyces rouxii]|uniref:ZYRO0C09482p n=1 Tax=Zygosaccharomyces rouxii (strain ATCC 2623 / CBS 732 / NBRC 1130 / NCYC 568 / NRRL Y-229) TaxID=559307 RepID=C5DTL4_ZYGRC|nr:uncharacterized protein ZYRO0C09482g [Zygosaccharomyces rouxii]KAH9201696.1 mitochondrial K+-H+ exchange-related-domain-containing protein [Zygosaccharomyces rouxii]CAR27125.1 ZYRO0C09482p [Zygosaccharomyces rouxii]